MSRRGWVLVVLAVIVLIGATLRLYQLSTVPTELIVDEIDPYNSAYSIATRGHDIDGTLRPFLYSPFTRNPPVYAVAAFASTLVFGRSAFALRLPAVLFGLAAILLIYAITLELTRRRDIAILAALLQATQPIFIQFSRIGWEPACELPFLLTGLYLLLRAFPAGDQARSADRVSFKHLAAGAVLLGLTSYTYMAGWFYALVLGSALILSSVWRFRATQAWKTAAAAGLIWLVVSLPALWMCFFDPLTAGKTQRVSTFAHGISFDALRVFVMNYFAHFRLSYLVKTGDPQPGTTWRYLNGFGAFYWWIIPLAAAGLASIHQYIRKKPLHLWVWIWLLAYPLGGALTNEGAPNAPRTLAGAPVFCILAAVGFSCFRDWIASQKPQPARAAAAGASALLVLGTGVSVVLFSSFYFNRYVHLNSNAWDSGTRAMFTAVRAHSGEYDRVCFSVRPAWYGIDAYTRFYLDDLAIHKITNITDPDCFLPGTLLVTDNDHPVSRRHFQRITAIDDVDGSKFALMAGRPRGETASY